MAARVPGGRANQVEGGSSADTCGVLNCFWRTFEYLEYLVLVVLVLHLFANFFSRAQSNYHSAASLLDLQSSDWPDYSACAYACHINMHEELVQILYKWPGACKVM